MTTRPDSISAAETEPSAPASCAAHTSFTKPSSYCALDSPMQITGLRPASRIARVLSPTISSVSPNNSRRSEWPTRTNSHPTLAAMAREVSPVYAPEEAWYTFWHPSATPEPFRMAATGARKGAGGAAQDVAGRHRRAAVRLRGGGDERRERLRLGERAGVHLPVPGHERAARGVLGGVPESGFERGHRLALIVRGLEDGGARGGANRDARARGERRAREAATPGERGREASAGAGRRHAHRLRRHRTRGRRG
jgi:hypothetical protein